MMRPYQKFLFLYAAVGLALCILLLINFIFIYRAWEHATYREIVRRQLEIGAIYGSTLNCNSHLYKLELAKQKKPEIIALGSSRILTLREEVFTRSFVNCGVGSLYLNQTRLFLEELFRVHKPKLILWGLDFWCFNDNYPQPEAYPDAMADADTDLLRKVKQPFNFWLENRLSLREYFAILLNGNNTNRFTTYRNLGLGAIKTSSGFRPDGSIFNSELIFGFRKDDDADIQFKSTLGLIEQARAQFVYGRELSQARVQEFLEIIRYCREQHVELVLYINPVAHRVYRKMAGMPGEYGFINELREFIKTLPVEAYDFHDIRDAGSHDCECIDGHHAGEVTQQKILLTIVRRQPQTILKKYLNLPLLQDKVAEFQGHALTKFDPSRYHYDEADFLKLGCKKVARRAHGAPLAQKPAE